MFGAVPDPEYGDRTERPVATARRPAIVDPRRTRHLVGTERGTATVSARETAKVRERLTRIQEQLERVRANERVLDEQVSHLDERADEAETRRLVARTPLADREWRDARTDLDRHATLLEEARRTEHELLAERDRLLERLFELEGPS